MPRFLPVLLAFLLVVPSFAAAPRIERIGGEKAFADGDLDALTLDEDGILRPGPSFEGVDLACPTAWAALEHGGATWIGTGNQGEVLRIDAEGEVQRIATGDTLLVTALAPLPAGTVAAAVVPGGVVHRVTAEGETEALATLPAEYVWSLAPDVRGGLLATTGMPAALWRIDAFGAVEKVADLDDDHARCMTRRGDEVLVGTAPKGLVLSVREGSVEVVRDLEAEEVIGIVALESGGLLVAANDDDAGGNPQALTNLLNQLGNIPPSNGNKKAPDRASLQNGEVLWLEPGGAVTQLWAGKKIAALAMIPDGNGAILGTYPSGRLYRVEPDRAPALVADLPEAEASVLLAHDGGLGGVVTSNPAFLHRRKGEAVLGTWTSEPIDAQAVARWGVVTTVGHGVETLEYRTGETKEPDDSWSAWKAAGGFDGRRGTTGAMARFLQVRTKLQGSDAELRAIEVVVAAPNRAPVIGELAVERPGKKDATGIPEPTTQRTVKWKSEDPDGDSLEVDVHANRDGSPHWIELVDGEMLSKPQHEWDTAGIPDGLYRIRVRVTDAPDNAPDVARETTRITAPFRVDNTPPRVTVRARPSGDRLVVEGEVADQPGGRIAQIRVSIDGGPWQVLGAADGLLDEASEAFAASLEAPAAGGHDVVVQSRDADGNVGAGATVVTIR